jgi:hypothetical protein
MRAEKTMATAPLSSEPMAKRTTLPTESYHRPECLSNKIDLLLGNLLFALQYLSNSREGATVLYAIDGLLRLKIDITHREGVGCG